MSESGRELIQCNTSAINPDLFRCAHVLRVLLQGLDEPFLEQWHQKIHQASSPEDVIIAEAYLAFLHTANHDDW